MWNSISRTVAAAALATGLVATSAWAQQEQDNWANWTGPFAGAALGGALLGSSDDNGIPGVTSRAHHHAWGGAGSAHLGYNFFTSSQILLGIEGDVSVHHGKSSATPEPRIYGVPPGGTAGTLSVTTESDWSVSLRARAGLPLGIFLPYMTAGVDFSDMTLRNTYGAFPGIVQTKNEVLPGFVYGGGLEVIVTSGISWRIEGLRTEFAKMQAPGLVDPGSGGVGGLGVGTGTVYTRTSHPTSDVIRSGFMFRF